MTDDIVDATKEAEGHRTVLSSAEDQSVDDLAAGSDGLHADGGAESAGEPQSTLGSTYANAAQQARQADVWVRNNPWAAVGIGLAVGTFLGMRRRRRSV